MKNAYIAGTGHYAPERVVTNDDLREEFGIDTNHEWIFQRTGIKERRFAPEGESGSSMGTIAAREAMERAGVTNRDVDMIVFCTLSPDYAFPGNGVIVQRELGMCDDGNFCPAIDIRNQCSGFLYGLATATSMIRSGGAKCVLLIGGECHSAGLDLTTRGRTVSSLFGDGAAAVVLKATSEDRGVRGWYLGADGRHAEALCQHVWNTKHRPFVSLDGDGNGVIPPEQLWAKMQGKQVFKHAVERMIGSLMLAFQKHELSVNDVDMFFFHQANLRINQYIQEQMGAPDEKFPSNIDRYGNTTAATIPSLMAETERDGRLKPGMKVACVAFGSGFTWGSAIIDW